MTNWAARRLLGVRASDSEPASALHPGVVIGLQSHLSLAYHRLESILQVRNSDFHRTADATLSVPGNPRGVTFDFGQRKFRPARVSRQTDQFQKFRNSVQFGPDASRFGASTDCWAGHKGG